ncbi:MAG TPA: hypothetical protein DEH25_05205 [Chloroflexi bacterium]|nr:hypothetical protein [Chloroflexota bacterium]HBY08227.1 hypothetical protein [Chloroflexota bacterium]
MIKRIVLLITAIIGLSLGLAWVSSGFGSLQGWIGFFGVGLLGVGILLGGWFLLKSDYQRGQSSLSPSHTQLPSWLFWLLMGAALLRLGVGIFWSLALPQWGYGGEVELAGYVMTDAFERDVAAWDLARSDLPLSAAFSEFSGDDQYGGLLFGSALVYRALGGATHQPLMMVVLAAAFSALAVIFTWGFARQVWDAPVAAIAAWVVALFPDAILLGSTQMREAFMMTLVVLAFYGLVQALRERSRWGLAWILAALLLSFPLSLLFAVMLAGMLAVFALFLTTGSWKKHWRVWLVLAALVALALVVIWLFGDQLLPTGSANPVKLLQRWLRQAARWQAYNTEHASGWMQKVFRTTPQGFHPWILLGYGVVRPFLPAALFDSAAPLWQGIAIWRSLGWVLLLPFLIIAPLLAWRRDGLRSPVMGLSILVWAVILVASFRGGGDNWDNPRYRASWIGLQAALAAWVWVTQRRDDSPWLRRALVAMGLILIWWIPWYLRRITILVWPVQDVFATLGLGLVSVLLYLAVEVWHERRQTADD